MKLWQKAMIRYLNSQLPDSYLKNLDSKKMAHLYVKAAYLVASLEFISEEVWLQRKLDRKQGGVTSFHDLVSPFFSKELISLKFLQEDLLQLGKDLLRGFSLLAQELEKSVLVEITSRDAWEHKIFLIQSLRDMTSHFIWEERLEKGPRLYRSFDSLDEIFDLNYSLDGVMKVDFCPKERLYQGSGVGVQSGYSTILLAIHGTKISPGSLVVDLGSGYGRVGLVCALLRSDTKFIGYEYVDHRVEVASAASSFLDLEDNLEFRVQDLSLPSFTIPDADVFYLYDPFTKSTYERILGQLVELSGRKKVTVVTKGNARGWLMEVADKHHWPTPIEIDGGNLCIFDSE